MAKREGPHLRGVVEMRRTMNRLDDRIKRAAVGSCCSGVWASMRADTGLDASARYLQAGRLCGLCLAHLLLTAAAPDDLLGEDAVAPGPENLGWTGLTWES